MRGSIDEYLNTVIEGDCLEVMERFPDKSIDMILCHTKDYAIILAISNEIILLK